MRAALIAVLCLLVILSMRMREPQELGWLAERQMQSRHDAAELIRSKL